LADLSQLCSDPFSRDLGRLPGLSLPISLGLRMCGSICSLLSFSLCLMGCFT
jgi:hypothetical protein